MAAAMRYVKSGDRSDLEEFSLPILRKADYQLADRDMGSGYRRAITDRIQELESESKKANIIDVKPSFYGLGINLNEVWRRFKAWLRRK